MVAILQRVTKDRIVNEVNQILEDGDRDIILTTDEEVREIVSSTTAAKNKYVEDKGTE